MSLLSERAKAVRVPKSSDSVYKEECVLSFATPASDGGIYVNLTTFQAYGANQLQYDPKPAAIYFHQQWTKVFKEKKSEENQPTKLAIGGDGGFSVGGGREWHRQYSVVVMPENVRYAYPSDEIPQRVTEAVEALLAHEGQAKMDEFADWTEEKATESKYAKTLIQLDNGVKISSDPKQWRCAVTGATENLWLNLSDGYIGDGRSQGLGLGGTGQAEKHFRDTGSIFPLVVKLGTITPQGADVYSYAPDEDKMVLDPYLADHLAHWGINILKLEKTEKTMEELQIDLNLKHSFDRIQESGSKLLPLVGPGLVGLVNTGNSCYINSLLQVLFTIPDFQKKYLTDQSSAIRSSQNPGADFGIQMSKVARALCTDTYLGMVPVKVEEEEGEKKKKKEETVTQSKQEQEPEQEQEQEEQEGTEDLESMGVEELKRYVQKQAKTSVVGNDKNVLAKLAKQSSPKSPSPKKKVWKVKSPQDKKAEKKEEKKGERKEEKKEEKEEKREEKSSMQLGLTVDLAPRIFRRLVGAGHPEFSTAKQQDVVFYFQHLVSFMDRWERTNGRTDEIGKKFLFSLEERLQCEVSKQVRYKRTAGENVFRVPVPEDLGTPVEEENQSKKQKTGKEEPEKILKIPFEACLQRWAETAHIEDFNSPATGKKGPATKTTRFGSFPHFLALQIARFTLAADWSAKKLNHHVHVPLTLDLEHLRGKGLQPGEQELPAAGGKAKSGGGFSPDPTIVSAITGMGFTENAAARACKAVKNSSPDAATNWLYEHMEDPDLNDPLPAESKGGKEEEEESFPADTIAMIASMGFTEKQVKKAMKATKGNPDRAVDWLYSRPEMDEAGNLPGETEGSAGGNKGAGAVAAANGQGEEDGKGKYRLIGFISHMGPNSSSGHYVCHIHKGGKWVIYNDEKVAESQNPPFEHGYLYFFERI